MNLGFRRVSFKDLEGVLYRGFRVGNNEKQIQSRIQHEMEIGAYRIPELLGFTW